MHMVVQDKLCYGCWQLPIWVLWLMISICVVEERNPIVYLDCTCNLHEMF